MSGVRTAILEWIEQGRVRPDGLPAALALAGMSPGESDWRRFLDLLTLWLGTVFCAAAVIFFFAYNWQEMGRFAKFALVELLIVASLVMCWRLDLERMSGKATLLMAILLTGALLALVGQTYQTGADTYELFAVWALAVLPWVLVARFGPTWLVWLGLANLAAVFYFKAFGGIFGWLFNSERQLWALFILNTLALVIWEGASYLGIAWLRERWSPRILATVSGCMATTLMLWAILDHRDESRTMSVLAYFAWMAVAYAWYRHRQQDIFVLAGGILSAVAVVATFLGKHVLNFREAGGYLFIGLVIIGLSAAGGLWLKSIAQQEHA